jgi:hypothetical protein
MLNSSTDNTDDKTELIGKRLSWYQRNKEKVAAKERAKYAANREEIAAQKRAQYAATKHLRKPLTEEQQAQKKARQKAWYEANKEYVLAKQKEYYSGAKNMAASSRLLKHFGITLSQYDAMFEAQGGRCAICRRKQIIYDRHGNLRRLSVDHDHKTGRVRQLLCSPCNTSIGLVKENIETLNGIIDYIKKHGEYEAMRIQISMTLDEVQTLAALLDTAVKASGLQGARAALPIIDKLEKAVAEANKPKPETVETE